MRIGISTSVVQSGKTGIARYLTSLLREFIRDDKGSLFTLFILQNDLKIFDFAVGKMHFVIVPERFRAPVANILWHQCYLPRLVKKYQLDVLHIPSYRRLIWSKPCALVATIHDLAQFHILNKYDRSRMFYGTKIAPILSRRQDEIIAISNHTSADVIRFLNVDPNRLTVIYNGLERSRFNQSSQSQAKLLVEQKCGILGSFFLYVSRLEHPAKNHVRLIEAFDQFKLETKSNWKLVFIGENWHGAELIHQAIAKSPFFQDIRCLGFVDELDLPVFYRAAEVFVYPSLFEGFGLPPLEAMACGCPVLCSHQGALSEILGKAAEFVDPRNVLDLKSKMVRLATSPTHREMLGKQGLVQVDQFCWKKCAETTLEVYSRAYSRVIQINKAKHLQKETAVSCTMQSSFK